MSNKLIKNKKNESTIDIMVNPNPDIYQLMKEHPNVNIFVHQNGKLLSGINGKVEVIEDLTKPKKPNIRVKLGETFVTRGVADRMSQDSEFEEFVSRSMERHRSGDWGCVPPEDAKLNDEGLENGDRLLSAYKFKGIKIWIITEWDRSHTTVLFPDEY